MNNQKEKRSNIEPEEPRDTAEAAAEYKHIVKDITTIKERTVIVDYGCGKGAFAIDGIKGNLNSEIKNRRIIEYIGIDIDEDYLTEAGLQVQKKNFLDILAKKPEFIRVQGKDLAIDANTADFVFLISALHDIYQIENLTDAFYNIFRILKPGGKFVIYDRSTGSVSDEVKYILWEKEYLEVLLRNLSGYRLDSYPDWSSKRNRFEIIVNISKDTGEIPSIENIKTRFVFIFKTIKAKYENLINELEKEQKEKGFLDEEEEKKEKIYVTIQQKN